MSGVYSAVPAAMDAHTAVCHATGETIVSAASADYAAHVAAAAAALGPIGLATYLPAFGQALANNLGAALQVGHVHHAVGLATSAHKAAVIAADNV